MAVPGRGSPSLHPAQWEIQGLFEPIEEIRVTGGLVGSSTWLRIAADVFGARIHVPETPEGSALGAAVMAWVALGLSADLKAARQLTRPGVLIEPDPHTHGLYRQQVEKADRILQAVKVARE